MYILYRFSKFEYIISDKEKSPEKREENGASSKEKLEIRDEVEEQKESTLTSDDEIINLNKALAKWVSGHVENDPICDLRPIFADYQKHMERLDEVMSLFIMRLLIIGNVHFLYI